MTPSLLTLKDIARMWDCNHRRARDVVVKQPGFPRPAPGSTPRYLRWREADVADFIDGKKIQEQA